MATTIANLIPVIRDRLNEPNPAFWGDDELIKIVASGVRDLWRDIVDLKQEHYLTRDITNVSQVANALTLTGVPSDVHKVYMIEPLDLTSNGSNHGLAYSPLDYNHRTFQSARGSDAIDPSDALIYYAITGAGAPVGAPTIYVAPKITSTVSLAFCYVPSLGTLTQSSTIPIPGEADNALIAWTVAFARAKEREDRAPDSNWLLIYSTEKAHLLQSLGLRDYQENTYAEAVFEDFWG